MPVLAVSLLGEGSPTKIDFAMQKMGALILTSLLEDLEELWKVAVVCKKLLPP